jgi:hypothetical protein
MVFRRVAMLQRPKTPRYAAGVLPVIMSDSFHAPDASSLPDQGNDQNSFLDFNFGEIPSLAAEVWCEI